MKSTKSEIQRLLQDCQSKKGTHHAVIVSKPTLEAICRELLQRRSSDAVDNRKSSDGNTVSKMSTHRIRNREKDNQVRYMS